MLVYYQNSLCISFNSNNTSSRSSIGSSSGNNRGGGQYGRQRRVSIVEETQRDEQHSAPSKQQIFEESRADFQPTASPRPDLCGTRPITATPRRQHAVEDNTTTSNSTFEQAAVLDHYAEVGTRMFEAKPLIIVPPESSHLGDFTSAIKKLRGTLIRVGVEFSTPTSSFKDDMI